MVERFTQNPLLTTHNIKPSREGFVVECVLNPGVFTFRGKIWLLLRVAERPVQEEGFISFPVFNHRHETEIIKLRKDDPELDLSDARVISYRGRGYLTTMSHLCLMCSDNGRNFYEPEDFDTRIFANGLLESFGIEDCRVSRLDDEYLLTYTQVSRYGVGVGLIRTRNWKEYDREGMIFPPHNKDCCIFEQKVNGKYIALHRPSGIDLGGNFIWIAESPDLIHWGNHRCVMTTRESSWDSVRVGAGAAPIWTDRGWLEIYHGADANHVYHLGAVLLDLEDPSRVIARSEQPILSPDMDYEKTGFFGNVVFSNGQVIEGDKITLYYGAADEVICGATLSIKEILRSLEPQILMHSNHKTSL